MGGTDTPISWRGAMIIQVLHCPNCQGTDIVRHGKTRQGKQRYRCREKRCAGRTFLLDYSSPGQSPEVKQHKEWVGVTIVEARQAWRGPSETASGHIRPEVASDASYHTTQRSATRKRTRRGRLQQPVRVCTMEQARPTPPHGLGYVAGLGARRKHARRA